MPSLGEFIVKEAVKLLAQPHDPADQYVPRPAGGGDERHLEQLILPVAAVGILAIAGYVMISPDQSANRASQVVAAATRMPTLAAPEVTPTTEPVPQEVVAATEPPATIETVVTTEMTATEVPTSRQEERGTASYYDVAGKPFDELKCIKWSQRTVTKDDDTGKTLGTTLFDSDGAMIAHTMPGDQSVYEVWRIIDSYNDGHKKIEIGSTLSMLPVCRSSGVYSFKNMLKELNK